MRIRTVPRILCLQIGQLSSREAQLLHAQQAHSSEDAHSSVVQLQLMRLDTRSTRVQRFHHSIHFHWNEKLILN